jgi:hypothetical protein
MRRVLRTSVAAAALILLSTPAFADPVSVVGVAVDKAGKRVGGVLVKLVAGATGSGVLAQDVTSVQGIFHLYVRNAGGSIDTLYVIGDPGNKDADFVPLKVAVGLAKDGLFDIRAPDLIVLPNTPNQVLTAEDAAERVAARAKTQELLVQTGLISTANAASTVETHAIEVSAKVPASQRIGVGDLTLNKLGALDVKSTAVRDAAAKVVTGRGRGGGSIP